MKNRFLQDLRVLLIACTITSAACGQPVHEMTDPPKQPLPEKIIPESKKAGLGQDSGLMLRNEINAKAARNFMKNFKDVTDAKWFKSANGLIVAYFANEKFRNWVFYNTDGDCEYMLRHYSEEQLASDVRHVVKSKYYDYSIYLVAEITRHEKIAYTVYLEDKKSWKIVRVIDGDMELMQDLKKSSLKD